MKEKKDCIFRPSKEGLIKAEQRRVERWNKLEENFCSREDQLERMKADIEVFECMKIVRERANQCIKKLENKSQWLIEA